MIKFYKCTTYLSALARRRLTQLPSKLFQLRQKQKPSLQSLPQNPIVSLEIEESQTYRKVTLKPHLEFRMS